jgi:two-component system phosphate regulon sensor histidine kinase PhoR
MPIKKKIEQVLLNLVENSIKYGRVNGFTEVRIDESQLGRVKIDIVDNGEGMDKQHLNRVFERFYRVEKSRNRDQGGSGLGLSIVKHILEAHNQEILVKSKVGKGSEFTFYLDKGV